jgi:hypothetical protein
MSVSIIVQTCDKYEKYWDGFFYYMDKFWDKKINYPIYFCNENKKINNSKFNLINTGSGSFVSNLKTILNKIDTKYVFYLLEDFWPINNFRKDLFDSVFSYVTKNKIKAFQISPYVPYYQLEKTNDYINDQAILKFYKNSDWRFNFQARFWDKDFLLNSLFEPTISESQIGTSLGVEIDCSNKLDKNTDIYLYHYFWYPMSGVSYRGNFTDLGREMQNNMMIDLYGKDYSSSS